MKSAQSQNAELSTLESEPRQLSLRFGDDVSELARRRIHYAMQSFCAVFEFDFASTSEADSIQLCYGCVPNRSSDVMLFSGYKARPFSESAPRPSFVTCQGIQFPRFHPTIENETDWLGEIFEWLSSADEQAIIQRDGAGRIPFSAGLHGRYMLDPCVPYAAVAMQELHKIIAANAGYLSTPQPAKDAGCTIVATHDIDFLPVSAWGTTKRFLKNIAIAAIAYRDYRLASAIAMAGLRKMGQRGHVLNCVPAMLARESEIGIRSSCNVLCRQSHRRDANYRIDDQATLAFLRLMERSGTEIGLHGSYTSLQLSGKLAEEYGRLTQLGFRAVGGRQHWLRYQDTSLFDELIRAEAKYDCSVGYSERVGFRAGACFAYAPYNFAQESAYPLLEIPLVLMDCALYCESRDPNVWVQQSQKVLQAVRRYGRGGVSILWHDTVFSGGQLPLEIGDLYWKLKKSSETWTTAADYAATAWPKFVKAGLFAENHSVAA